MSMLRQHESRYMRLLSSLASSGKSHTNQTSLLVIHLSNCAQALLHMGWANVHTNTPCHSFFYYLFLKISSDRVMSRLRDAHVAEDTEGHWLIGPVQAVS